MVSSMKFFVLLLVLEAFLEVAWERVKMPNHAKERRVPWHGETGEGREACLSEGHTAREITG